jgi:hypothetical protein
MGMTRLFRALHGNTYTFIKPAGDFLWNDKDGYPSQIIPPEGAIIELHDATIYQNFSDDCQRYNLPCAISTFFKALKVLSKGTGVVIYEAK